MPAHKPLTVKLADIDVSNRVQPLDEAIAEQIAQTIRTQDAARGMMIELRHTPNGARKWALISGRHRLRAFELVGTTELVEGVHFKVLKVDATEARLLEIEENLARNDVTPFSRAVMLVAYRDALGLDGRGGDRRTDDFKLRKSAEFEKSVQGFMALAMKTFDLSPDQYSRLIQIGHKLTVPTGLAERLHFSPIARNQSQLLKLAGLAPENLERGAVVFDAVEGDFGNLFAILSEPPERQAEMLEQLREGADIESVVAVARRSPLQSPAFDFRKQAISSFSQLSHKDRSSAVVDFWKQDQKAIREGLLSLGWTLVKVKKVGAQQ